MPKYIPDTDQPLIDIAHNQNATNLMKSHEFAAIVCQSRAIFPVPARVVSASVGQVARVAALRPINKKHVFRNIF
jgi:hypothetical protein